MTNCEKEGVTRIEMKSNIKMKIREKGKGWKNNKK